MSAKDFVYLAKEDYDKEYKLGGDSVEAYSKQKLQELYPAGDAEIVGEADRKKGKAGYIGRIELADERLFVRNSGAHNKVFRKQDAFVAVDGGGFIALLKLRLLPVILIAALLLGGVCGCLCGILGGHGDNTQPAEIAEDIDPNIQPAQTDIITVSGTVSKDGACAEGAVLSLQSGNEEVGTATTDKDGNYLIADVKNGNYNLVCTYGDSVLTKLAVVDDQSVVIDFRFPADDLHDVAEITGASDEPEASAAGGTNAAGTAAGGTNAAGAAAGGTNTAGTAAGGTNAAGTTSGGTDTTGTSPAAEPTAAPAENTSAAQSGGPSNVKAMINIIGENTPAIAVGGLDKEAIRQMIEGKEVDLILSAELLENGNIPETDKAAIEEICGELQMTYYDFKVQKDVYSGDQLESSEYLTRTDTVLELAVPYDSSYSVGTYVFRYHDGEALRMTELSERPTGSCQDGTYYVTANTVYIYTDCFSTYAIGAANGTQVTRGSDTITYSSEATVDLNTGKIAMMYEHDADSTNAAKVELYLVGQNGNLLIAESGTIPAGYSITEMDLISDLTGMPSVGTYDGLMKIIYLDTEGSTSTNVDIPLSVAITQ